jgi:hypothetical protein
MLSQIVGLLQAARHQHPVLFHLALVFIALLSLGVAILDYFKLVGKRRARNGTRPRLPPGPPGLPLLGLLSLLASKKNEDLKDEVRLALSCRLAPGVPC